MTRRSGAFQLVWILLCLGMLAPSGGCSKRAVSSSGDQTATADERKPAPRVETIQPDQMVAAPESRSTPLEAGREPSTAPSPGEPIPGRPRTEAPSTALPPSSAPGSPAPAAPFAAPSPATMALGDIFFDFDRYAVRSDAQPVLESNALWIKNSTAKSILIEGHCDERGTQAYNLVLGEKRARATKQYLQDLGVPASRLKIVSYGEVRPFCNGRDEQCYQLNRRAHFVPQ